MMAALLTAIVVGFGATWLIRGVAIRWGYVNHPNRIVPQHRTAVAYGGGIGIFVGWVGGLIVADAISMLILPVFGALLLGAMDDRVNFSPSIKFLLQIVVATVFVWALEIPIMTGLPVLDSFISGLIAVLLMNAVNLTDVCDGLAGGLGAIALAASSAASGTASFAVASAACLGFLFLNRPPATIYLGDAGAHAIGLLLAAAGMALISSKGPLAGLTSLLLVNGIFLFELVLLIYVRIRRGIAPWRGSPDHFSLRMQAGPFSRTQTVLIAWGAGLFLAGGVLAGVFMPQWFGPYLLMPASLSGIGAGALVMRWEVQR